MRLLRTAARRVGKLFPGIAAVKTPWKRGQLRIAEVERTVREVVGLQRLPHRVGQVRAGLHYGGEVGHP